MARAICHHAHRWAGLSLLAHGDLWDGGGDLAARFCPNRPPCITRLIYTIVIIIVFVIDD